MYENIPEVMTLKECCEILRVGKNTMLELLHSNRIEGFRVTPKYSPVFHHLSSYSKMK